MVLKKKEGYLYTKVLRISYINLQNKLKTTLKRLHNDKVLIFNIFGPKGKIYANYIMA